MVIEIFGDDIIKADVKHLTPHVGARGIIKKDDLYLLVYLKNAKIYTLPGGGVHRGESFEEAVLREVKEETGCVCKVIKKGVTLKEYFHDSVWHHHYYVLDVVEHQESSLTNEEIALGLTSVWMTLEEVLDVLSQSESDYEHADAILNREFIGFTQSL